MFDADQSPVLAARLRTLQIIVAAMALGVLAFLVIVLLLPRDDPGDRLPIISYIAVAYGVLACLAVSPITKAVVSSARRKIAREGSVTPGAANKGDAGDGEFAKSDLGKLVGLLAIKTLVNGAVYEGAALFLCVAYIVDHGPLTALLAVLLAAGVLSQTPTRDRAHRWLDDQRRQLEQERQG
jgi:hypothetical protein